MYTKSIHIDICIATYKRVDWLKELLHSLVNQLLGEGTSIKIIIIDNDIEGSAYDAVSDFFLNKPIPYIYDIQPEKNIALTRNKSLEHISGDYIAFVDDDEWVSPNWLETLINACKGYNADVVFGPVIPLFPENTPKWIIDGKFFEKFNETGKTLKYGPTSNTLVKISDTINPYLKFDPTYGLTGGSDTELFNRLFCQGAKLVWCNEAVVYERVTKERLTVNWLLKRALRNGQVYAKIFHLNQSAPDKTFFIIKRLTYLLFASLLLPPALFTGKAKWVWVLRKISSNFGQISMLITKNGYQEYK